jgi:hypothetical protein
MFGHIFYHGLIRKYVSLFGTLFNDIYINVPDDANVNEIVTLKVPISYGPREKVLARVTADPNLNRMPAVVLPRMAFEMDSITYAPERKLNTVGKRYAADTTSTNKLKYTYNPVPYDLKFTLSILVKNAEDGTRIVEQILPFFTPEWTTTVELIPDMDIVVDIPLVLNSINVQDDYEGDYDKRRYIMWTLSFTMKAYMYGPIRKSNVIKFANVNVYSLGPNTLVSTTNVRPGLTANGTPTSNSANSIDITYINADDDYGYIVTKTDNI